ncbi:MAG: protein-disulfide reductase DsbD family protein, partial [Ignavibacteriaceae bacterium]|nr:protein-disulfide reductase DsbD family protein [Ignavibacteriaceae bacterium]
MKKYFVLLFVLMVSNSAFPQIGKPLDLVKIKAYQSFDKIVSGTEFKIAVKVNIDPLWHINSNKPYEDFLIPSVLSIDTSSGFRLSKIKYPQSHDRKLAFSDKPLSVFENEIYTGALVKSPSSLKPGTYKLPVVFDYQSCNDKTCLPPNSVSDTLTIE